MNDHDIGPVRRVIRDLQDIGERLRLLEHFYEGNYVLNLISIVAKRHGLSLVGDQVLGLDPTPKNRDRTPVSPDAVPILEAIKAAPGIVELDREYERIFPLLAGLSNGDRIRVSEAYMLRSIQVSYGAGR